MSALKDILSEASKKASVIEDCCALIDAEVADKGGLSGVAIKTAFKAVKGVKPGFIRHAVEDLLPEFADALDPLYQEARAAAKPTAPHFQANAARMADALLGITDRKASRAKSGLVKSTYERLRGTAKKHVETAAPRLGALVAKHAG